MKIYTTPQSVYIFLSGMSAFPEDYSRKRLPSARDFLIARSVFERNMHELEVQALLRDICALKSEYANPKYVCSFIKISDDLLRVEGIWCEPIIVPVRYSECERISDCGSSSKRTFIYEKQEDESVYKYMEEYLGVNLEELNEIGIRYHDKGILSKRTKRSRIFKGRDSHLNSRIYESKPFVKSTVVNLHLYIYRPAGKIPFPSEKGFLHVYAGDNDAGGIFEVVVREDGKVKARQTNVGGDWYTIDEESYWCEGESGDAGAWELQLTFITKIPIFGPRNKPIEE